MHLPGGWSICGVRSLWSCCPCKLLRCRPKPPGIPSQGKVNMDCLMLSNPSRAQCLTSSEKELRKNSMKHACTMCAEICEPLSPQDLNMAVTRNHWAKFLGKACASLENTEILKVVLGWESHLGTWPYMSEFTLAFRKMLQNVCSHSKEGQLLDPAGLWEGWRLHTEVLQRVSRKLLPESVQLNRIIIWPLLTVHTQRTPKLNNISEQWQTHRFSGRREQRSHSAVMCYLMTLTILPQNLPREEDAVSRERGSGSKTL